jgi:putative SbcD/Mre11-related phosphoesterase
MHVLTDWLLTPERAAVHLPTATAVVADLHLGYGDVRRRRGEAVPLCPPDETLGRLGRALDRLGVRRLVVAGDLLEDGRRAAVTADLLRWLGRAGLELVGVVPGNHDRRGGDRVAVAGVPVFPEGFAVGRWRVVHGDGPLPRGRLVQGHEHPCVRWAGGLAAPCYLVDSGRLILPALSPDAAGVNVLPDRRWARFRCCVIVADEVLDFGRVEDLRRATDFHHRSSPPAHGGRHHG